MGYTHEQIFEAEALRYWDDSLEGKILTLKQQYTLCSASLQDIITCFEKMSRETMMWNEFPQKVVVQMNDTHPTLCIPDDEDIHFVRTVAYTNHTVLPEALTKSQWRAAKRINKLKVVSFLKEKIGYSVSPNAMFDIQVEKALSNVQMKTKECIEAGDMKRYSDKRWSYRDPNGNIHGLFSLAQLRSWKDYFPSDLQIWSYYDNVKEAILLHNALSRQTKDAG
ncbi:alpha-1,4 glucan phosphorylase L isozyme, chloroplastic/amyloplastic isoform X2 [Tanacetum coccineum]|uniref:Alpha-1,4 glucan phosphorylase n=1 Tax=Tanacetum coccineum TaxID=301880 RepID=A0ABQ5E6K9_9ASTR